MITRIANRLSGVIISLGAGEEEDREVYVYGLDMLLSTGVNLLCALAMAWITGEFLVVIGYLSFFIGLRAFAGGYHADTHLGCLLVMLIALGLSILFVYVVPVIFYLWIAVALMILSASLIFLYAPVEHPNRPLTAGEVVKFRKISRIAFCIETGLIMGGFLLFSHLAAFFMAAALGMVTSALSCWAAVIINTKDGVSQ